MMFLIFSPSASGLQEKARASFLKGKEGGGRGRRGGGEGKGRKKKEKKTTGEERERERERERKRGAGGKEAGSEDRGKVIQHAIFQTSLALLLLLLALPLLPFSSLTSIVSLLIFPARHPLHRRKGRCRLRLPARHSPAPGIAAWRPVRGGGEKVEDGEKEEKREMRGGAGQGRGSEETGKGGEKGDWGKRGGSVERWRSERGDQEDPQSSNAAPLAAPRCSRYFSAGLVLGLSWCRISPDCHPLLGVGGDSVEECRGGRNRWAAAGGIEGRERGVGRGGEGKRKEENGARREEGGEGRGGGELGEREAGEARTAKCEDINLHDTSKQRCFLHDGEVRAM
eukprot:340218-Hanusia_phi.AAC.1